MNLSEYFRVNPWKSIIEKGRSLFVNYQEQITGKEKKCFMNLIRFFHEEFLRGKIKSYENLRRFFILKTEEILKYTRKTLINHVKKVRISEYS